MEKGLAAFEEANWASGKRGWLSELTDNAGVYRHPLGLAEWATGHGWTWIGTICDGRVISRRWPRGLGRRTISRLCREMLEDLCEAPAGHER